MASTKTVAKIKEFLEQQTIQVPVDRPNITGSNGLATFEEQLMVEFHWLLVIPTVYSPNRIWRSGSVNVLASMSQELLAMPGLAGH